MRRPLEKSLAMRVSEEFKKEEFIERYRKNPFNPYVIFPALLKTLGDVNKKKVLDLGCGPGEFSRILAERGAEVVGVDKSKKCIDICRRENANLKNFRCFISDCSNLSRLRTGTFDFAVMSLVVLSIPTKKKLERTFKEGSRVLKKSGEFIFTDLNPVCLMTPETATEARKYLPNFSYFKDGSKYESTVTIGSTIKFVDVHWTLETYTRALSQAGMYIYRIIEPQPIKSAPEILKHYTIPEFIIFQCRKL
jgi:ubiquinone/menaquinone biosynthesis C-methylase UbiE